MINVSNEFKELMSVRTNFKQYAVIMLKDTTLRLDETQFTASNNYIIDGAGMNTIPIGVAIQKNIQIEIMNDNGQYSDIDFTGALISLYIDYQLSSTTERISKGVYTVLSPATYGDTIIITAVDDMHFADIEYNRLIDYPATAAEALRDICQICGILKGNISFDNDSFVIQTAPKGTCRQIIGYIAMLACGNARINNDGELDIIPYDFTGFDTGNYHTLKNFTYPKFEAGDVSVTGVKMVIKGETADLDKTVIVGSEGYVLTVENPLVEGQEDVLLTWLYEAFSGAPIRPFSGDMISNPLVEFMDLAKIVDRHGNEYNTVITDVNFQVLGYTTVKNTFPNAIQLSSTYPSDAARVEQLARKWVEYERQSRQEAVKKLNEDLAASSGLYQTDVEQADGSTISYFHDKPTLEESKNVLKITAEAIGISNDGGETYHGGFTFDAETVMKFIETEGLEAEWVKVGSKTITTVIDENVSNLQAQIDNNIESHYYDYAPTLENEPAASWTTEEERKKHEGDLFFDKSTGYKYRFFSGDSGTGEGAWEWRLIKDTDITSALQSIKEVETNLSVFEGEITASVEETNKTAENAQKTASEAKVAVGSITLVVTGSDGTQAELKIGSDGKINLTGDVIAQKIFTDLLMAQNLKATGSFQVDNGTYSLTQTTDGLGIIAKGSPLPKAQFGMNSDSAMLSIYDKDNSLSGLALYRDGGGVALYSGEGCGLNMSKAEGKSWFTGKLQVWAGAESFLLGHGDAQTTLSALFAEKVDKKWTGLGSFSTEAELNTALTTKLNGMSGGEEQISFTVTFLSSYAFVGKIAKTSSGYGFVSVSNGQGGMGGTAFKYCNDGTWLPLEWENPPMAVGMEYRTTKRWKQKPVYTKLISTTNTSALSGTTGFNFSHGISDLETMISVDGTTSGYLLPYASSAGTLAVSAWSASTVYIQNSGTSWSAGRTWYFTMEYIKSTD